MSNPTFSATATATISGTSSSTSTSTGSTLEEAQNNAINCSSTSAYFSLAPPTHNHSEKTCQQCCLSCVDFRFAADVAYNQNIKGDCENYDPLVLAGASLGYNGIPGYNNWILFADQTIELLSELHKISEVIIYDHMECGAYTLAYTPEELEGDGEYKLHIENLNKAEATILKRFPFIKKVYKKLINIDATITTIP